MAIIVPEIETMSLADTPLTIDAETRLINTSGELLLGVEMDNDSERVRFQCPKVVGDDINLSDHHIYIHYMNAGNEKGKYLCEDVEDTGENITFSWLLSDKAVRFKGETKFLVCAKKGEEDPIVWHTTLATGKVLEGLDVDEDIVQQNDDIIEQMLVRIEALEKGGGSGGSYTLPVATDTVLGGVKAIKKTTETTPVAVDEEGKLWINEPSGVGEGMTIRQINALNELFKICAYTQNPSSQYNEFLQAFDIGGVEPSESWKITNNLTNVVNNNNAIYVIKGSPYSATLTASEGYSINSVIVEMGGEDVTSTVYSDGSINISSVTGDVVITATAEASPSTGLPQDGLLGMFDFRNATDEQYNLTGWGNVYKVNSPENKTLLAFSGTQIQNSNEYGVETISNYTIRELRRIDDESKSLNLGQEFTISAMAYGVCVPSLLGWITKGNVGTSVIINAKYIDSLDAKKSMNVGSQKYVKSSEYSIFSLVVNNNTAKIYFEGDLLQTVESSTIEDFKSFISSPIDAGVSYSGEGHYLTAVAIYDRVLSDIEIVEVAEYLKTLEVNE